MACYDCENCSKHINNGSKCDEWEYTCPFNHLDGFNKEDKENKLHDLNIAKEFNNKLKYLIEEFKENLKDEYNYEEIIRQLYHTQSDLDDMVDYYPKKFKEYGYL